MRHRAFTVVLAAMLIVTPIAIADPAAAQDWPVLAQAGSSLATTSLNPDLIGEYVGPWSTNTGSQSNKVYLTLGPKCVLHIALKFNEPGYNRDLPCSAETVGEQLLVKTTDENFTLSLNRVNPKRLEGRIRPRSWPETKIDYLEKVR